MTKTEVKKVKTLESAIEVLNNIPYSSKVEYEKALKSVQKLAKAKHGTDHILTIDREFLQDAIGSGVIEINNYRQRSPIPNIGELGARIHRQFSNDSRPLYSQYMSEYELSEILKMKSMMSPGNPTRFLPRNEVEYDIRFKQVISCGYIRSGDKIVLLSREPGKKHHISTIGGHTDFHISAYSDNPLDILYYNFKKELREEVKIKLRADPDETINPYGRFNYKLKYFVNRNSQFYSYRNCLAVFEVTLQDGHRINDFIIETNEPMNHSVRIMNMREFECLDPSQFHGYMNDLRELIIPAYKAAKH